VEGSKDLSFLFLLLPFESNGRYLLVLKQKHGTYLLLGLLPKAAIVAEACGRSPAQTTQLDRTAKYFLF
jgi:hypothetical protein